MKKLLALMLTASLLALAPTAFTQAAAPFDLSPSSYSFYYVQGGNPPTQQTGTITSTLTSTFTYTLSVPNQPHWLNESYTTSTLTAYPAQPMGIGAAADPTGLAVGTYSTFIKISVLTGSYAGSEIDIPITLTVQPAGSSTPSYVAHPEGTNIVASDGTVYRIMNGQRYPYTSAGAFLSYGYNGWADVQQANSADLALSIAGPNGAGTPSFIAPRDGSLISDHGTVYLISNGYRMGFSSAQVFLGLGYSFANVLPGDTSFLTTLAPINSIQISHPAGTVVNVNGTICVVEGYFQSSAPGRRCFSSLADMNTWGIQNKEIIPANDYDRQLSITRVISARSVTSTMNP